MRFLKRRTRASVAACLMAFGMIAVITPPVHADYPTAYIDRNILLKDPAPPGSPAAGLPAGGPYQISLRAGTYIWCVSLTALGDQNTCRVLQLAAGTYNWRCYLSQYNTQHVYYGNCLLDLLPAGSALPGPAGKHYYTLPADGKPRYWTISGERYYGWTSSLDPLSF